MNDQLREYCEQVRAYPRGYSIQSCRLAANWLAEHPADDETPVDVKWLDTLNPDDTHHGDWFRWYVSTGDAGSAFSFTIKERNDGRWEAWVDVTPLHIVNTRGDVRQAAKVFKIDLKEGAA